MALAPSQAASIPPMPSSSASSPFKITAAALGAATLLALTGCGRSTAAKVPTARAQASAIAALRLAARQSTQVRFLTVTATERELNGPVAAMTGTVRIQLKPSSVTEATFNVPRGQAVTAIKEIVTNSAIYFKDHAFAKQTGKPWIMVKLAQLSSNAGISLAAAFQNLASSDPLDQAQLLTASTDVRAVGAALVGTVRTTEYAGSYLPSAALARLAPALRALLGPMLRQMGQTPVRFRVWIDGKHLIRKVQDTQTVAGLRTTTTLTVTSVNKRTSVRLPARRQIAALPKI